MNMALMCARETYVYLLLASICYTKYQLQLTDSSDHKTFKKLYEKLADGVSYVENDPDAIDYYLKQLNHAELAGDSGKTLSPIYGSLSHTYREMGAFVEALYYYEKNYELVKDVPKEAMVTLSWYAETLFLAKRPYDQVDKACFDARNAARDCKNPKAEIKVLETLLTYQEEYDEIEKMVDTKLAITVIGNEVPDILENSEIQSAAVNHNGYGYTTPIGNGICLDDLTDTEEEDVTDNQNETRRKGREYIIGKINVVDTQLHVACSSGNKQLVKKLIGKGHPVNIRDNAGWLPLHQACIHGHTEIVDILINSGADVNVRRGIHRDGTTLLHDAASNGHLEIVQLLLDSGAKPSLKSDKGETTSPVLEKWQAGTNLDKDTEILYSNICNKLHTYIDTFHTIDSQYASISKTNVEAEKDFTALSARNLTSKTKDPKVTSVFRRRVIMEDDSDDDDSDDDADISRNVRSQACDDLSSYDNSDKCDKTLTKVDTLDTNEYRNTLLTVKNEVDDGDCFDDVSCLQSNKQKRKLCGSLNVVAKKPTCDSLKDSTEYVSKRKTLVDNNKANLHNESKLMTNNILFINENSLDSDEKKFSLHEEEITKT